MMSASRRVCRVAWGVVCSAVVVGCGSSDKPLTALPLPPENSAGAFGASGASGASGVAGGPNGAAGFSDVLFEGSAVHAEHSAPVVGGTLLLTRDGQTIAVADPDRDAVFLVDSTSRAVRTVSLERADEPGRIVEGAGGQLYVALRRAGALVTIDIARATVTARASVCASPRGLAYDARSGSLYVACRSGQLLTLDPGDLSRKRALQLDADLRDVIVRERDLVVTRFLNAEVMVVAADGSVSRRARPNPVPGCAEATVAFRAFSVPGGHIALAHQVSSDESVNEGPSGYGASCGGALVTRFLSLVNPDQAAGVALPGTANGGPTDAEGNGAHSSMSFQSAVLPAAGPLDVAFSPLGDRIAVIALDDSLVGVSPGLKPAISEESQATLWVAPWAGPDLPPFTFLHSDTRAGVRVAGQPVAVAFSAAGKYLVQSREPATLEFEGGESVSLSGESHADTGHRMFHMNSGIGVACSSCHPEGGEDGHVWRFSEGLRRTLPLEGGVMARAPFHWDGTLGNMGELVNEVMVKRMGLPAQPSEGQIAALGSFLDQLPSLAPVEGLDAAAVKRGAALFGRTDVACASCHSGPQYTNNQLVDVGTGGEFVTPSLLGVGLRSALFHDGCAKSISQRFGPCGGTDHGKPELLSADERADLSAFLRSL